MEWLSYRNNIRQLAWSVLILTLVSLVFSSCDLRKNDRSIAGFDNLVDLPELYWADLSFHSKDELGALIVYPAARSVYGYCGWIDFWDVDDEQVKEIYRVLDKESIQSIQLFDSCNFFITDRRLVNSPDCLNGRAPIPDVNIDSPLQMHYIELSKTSKVFIIDHQNGIFLNNYIEIEKALLSEEVNHSGFSNGIIIDEVNSLVGKWLLIW